MERLRKHIQWRRFSGEPIAAGDVVVTPESQALIRCHPPRHSIGVIHPRVPWVFCSVALAIRRSSGIAPGLNLAPSRPNPVTRGSHNATLGRLKNQRLSGLQKFQYFLNNRLSF